MKKLAFLLGLFLFVEAFAAGTVTVTRDTKPYGKDSQVKHVEVITIDWTGDSSDGSVPEVGVPIAGYVVKAVTNPGSTAPTSNYDIALEDPEDNALDALSAALNNRHTTNTEQVYPMIAGSPGAVTSGAPFLLGSYNFSLSGNSVASATGRLILYVVSR